MNEEENWILSNRLRALAARVAAGVEPAQAESLWRDAQKQVDAAGAGEEADVALPVLERSLTALQALIASWDAGRLPLPAWDQAVAKRALKAYRRRLDLTRSDDEYSSSRNPMSKGMSSAITGVRPPDRYPQEVWDLLVAQGKLRDAGGGLLELATI